MGGLFSKDFSEYRVRADSRTFPMKGKAPMETNEGKVAGSTGALEASDKAAADVAKTSKRVTLDQIKACVKDTSYVRQGTLTIAVRTCHNGWQLVGLSACVPEGDTYYFESEHGASRFADCPGCNPNPRKLGTPLSELSGRPGQPGFAEFCRIARSWGHE